MVTDGVLYLEATNFDTQDKEVRLVVPSSLRTPLIRMIHDGPTGGHTGITKTKDQVRRQAYWPGWTKAVELFVLSCVPCARYRNRKAPKQGRLQPMIASRPFETLSIDFTGPHPRSSNGYVYILTIVDHFSKFAFAYPMRNQEATTVAKILIEQVICLVGTPARILTDQGPNFESILFKELCLAFGIAKIRTSPYKASTNAGAERFHLTLNTMLAKKVKESQRDWDTHLQSVMAAYRATRHASTSLSPNFIIFGRENVMPSDLVLCNANVLQGKVNSVQEFVAEQQEQFRSAYQVARDHLRAAAQKQKAYYDATVRAKQFSVGDWVWYFYPRKYIKRSRKWGFTYVGPYEIVQQHSWLTFAIRKTPRDKPIVVHIDKLKKCVNHEIHSNTVNVNNEIVSVGSPVTLSSYMDRHEPPSACDYCERVFTRKSDLSRHRQDVHERVKTACAFCEAVLGSRRAWKKHIRNLYGEGSGRIPKSSATASTSRTGQKPDRVSRRVCWDNPLELRGASSFASYVPVLPTPAESTEGEVPALTSTPRPLTIGRTPKETVGSRLAEFAPNGADRKHYNKVEEQGDHVEVISSTQSEIKADVMWAADKSVSPSLLMDASMMHFSALGVSAIPSNFVADDAGTVIPGITGPDDLGTEVSEFLRSSDTLRDSCFTFDLEFINEVCSYDI